MSWKYASGDFVKFNTTQSDLIHLNGKVFEVLRRLTEDEADFCETGPMYRLGIDGYVLGEKRIEIDAFEDELTLDDVTKFRRMVNTYRALGYRMVVFDVPNDASWLCCFDTNGIDADSLPIEAFANEDWLRDLRNYASWSGPVEDVTHMDVTDDDGEMVGCYDYTANFPVMQLVSDYR